MTTGYRLIRIAIRLFQACVLIVGLTFLFNSCDDDRVMHSTTIDNVNYRTVEHKGSTFEDYSTIRLQVEKFFMWWTVLRVAEVDSLSIKPLAGDSIQIDTYLFRARYKPNPESHLFPPVRVGDPEYVKINSLRIPLDQIGDLPDPFFAKDSSITDSIGNYISIDSL